MPFIIILIVIEIYIDCYPNAFNKKAKYLKEQEQDILCLFLGSSHTQNSINPEYLQLRSANLAYGSQDYQLDSALFFAYAAKIKKLKYLFMEIDYHSLEDKNDASYFRYSWYYKYYGIKMGKLSFMDKIFLYPSAPVFFNNYIWRKLDPREQKDSLNAYGFLLNDYDGIFKELAYNESALRQTAKSRLKNKHTNLSIEYYRFNTHIMNTMVRYCLAHDIHIVLLKNPVYKTYISNYIPEKQKRREDYIDSLLKSSDKIRLLDFESDSRFSVYDFKDDNHLNASGAKKLSLILNSLLMSRAIEKEQQR